MSKSTLRIEVERLLKGPIERDFEFAPAEFDLLDDPEFRFDRPIRGSVTARLAGPYNVLLTGRMTTTTRVDCVRCLHPMEIPLDVTFQTVFLPKSQEEDYPDDPEDEERQFYTGDILDPTEHLREELMLALPDLPSCEYESLRECPHGRELGEAIAGGASAKPAEEPLPNSWQAQIARLRRDLGS